MIESSIITEQVCGCRQGLHFFGVVPTLLPGQQHLLVREVVFGRVVEGNVRKYYQVFTQCKNGVN